MKDKRKKLIIIMAIILGVLVVAGIVVGITKSRKQAKLEEQGIIYQDGAEGVEIWDDEDIISDENEEVEVTEDGSDSAEGSNSDNADNSSSENKNSSSTDKGTSNSDNKSSNGKDKNSGNKGSSNKGNSESNGNSSSNAGNTGNSNSSGSDSSDDKPAKVPAAGKGTYEQYMAMTPAQQQKYFESFDSEQEFFEWYRKAKAEYDKKADKNTVSGGSIDIGDYMD